MKKEIEEKLATFGISFGDETADKSFVKITNYIEKTPHRIAEEAEYMKYLESI